MKSKEPGRGCIEPAVDLQHPGQLEGTHNLVQHPGKWLEGIHTALVQHPGQWLEGIHSSLIQHLGQRLEGIHSVLNQYIGQWPVESLKSAPWTAAG